MKQLLMMALLLVASPLRAQELDLSSLDALAERASNVANVNIAPEVIELARAFLSPDNDDEAAALRITDRLSGIRIRSYEFDGPGQYQESDLDPVRAQLDAEGWTRIIEVDESGDRVGIWIYMDQDNGGRGVRGTVVLSEQPAEVAVVNIIGMIGLSDLVALGSQFNFGDLEDLRRLGEQLDDGNE